MNTDYAVTITLTLEQGNTVIQALSTQTSIVLEAHQSGLITTPQFTETIDLLNTTSQLIKDTIDTQTRIDWETVHAPTPADEWEHDNPTP